MTGSVLFHVQYLLGIGHLQRALDNGLTKNELSEVITHLAFYAGWPAAMTAAQIAKDVFAKR